MTVEAKIPLNDLKVCLYNYSCLYAACTAPKRTFDYKMRIARKTISSLFFCLLKIILFAVFIALASTTESDFLLLLWAILSIVTGLSVLLDLFYRQAVPGKRFKKLRFRYTYYIQCIVRDIYEIGWFKKYFGVKTPTILLIYGKGKAEAYRNIEDWGYMVGEDYIKIINQYNTIYCDYRDYVNFDSMWYLCGDLLSILNSGRATDIQGAMAVVDRNAHMQRIENIVKDTASRIADAHERAAAAARDAANAARDAANTWNDAGKKFLDSF